MAKRSIKLPALPSMRPGYSCERSLNKKKHPDRLARVFQKLLLLSERLRLSSTHRQSG